MTVYGTFQHWIRQLFCLCLHPVIIHIQAYACSVTPLHQFLMEEVVMSGLNLSQLTRVSTVLNFSTETIPFFSDDVTSMFGPLVGGPSAFWHCIPASLRMSCWGQGFGQNRRCNGIRELHTLNGGGHSSWAGIKRGSQSQINQINFFFSLLTELQDFQFLRNFYIGFIFLSSPPFAGQRSILLDLPKEH